MEGTITSYIRDKKYGFIKGDDGKDYFFHFSQFKHDTEKARIADEAVVAFDAKATPKGYQAHNCRLMNMSAITRYMVPDEVYTSKTDSVRGWQVMDEAPWIVSGSSRDSPDDAKDAALQGASRVGANALLNFEYYKTKGSETSDSGRGTYHFTIHNFCGRIANIAKPHAKGTVAQDDLNGLGEAARLLKIRLKMKSQRSLLKMLFVWVAALSGGYMYIKTVDDFSWLVILGVAAFIILFGRYTNYDNWLEEE